MHISIVNQQSVMKVEAPAIRKLAAFFLMKSSHRTDIKWGEVSVVLVDDPGSRAVNAAHLDHDYATDVISFTFEAIPGESETGLSGEIVVNAEQALRMGKRYNGPTHELALYIAHGCDHLSGEDDQTPAQRQRMRRRELRWIREAREREGFRVQAKRES